MNPPESSLPRRRQPLAWAALALWGLIVPLACTLTAAVVLGQGARAAAAQTAAAAIVPRVATVAVGTSAPVEIAAVPAATRTARTAPPSPTDTVVSSGTPTRTPTHTPAPSATRRASPTVSPTATNPGERVIGYSVAGRPLTVTQFGSGPVVRMLVAGIHGGNEWNTIALADDLSAFLRDQPERVPPDVTLYILRALNPDGAARGTGITARANEHNVDLNRNWPSRWQADWSRDGCWKYLRLSGGTHGASEPETQALMQFLLENQVDAVISYHSAALGIFAGGQPPEAASINLAEAVAEVSDYPYPALDFGCVYTGQLIDWASEQGLAALDVELTNHTDTDFEQNLRILDVFLNWRR